MMSLKSKEKETVADFIIQKAARNIYVVGEEYVVMRFNTLECGCSEHRRMNTCMHTEALEAILCHSSNRTMHP